jgi:hypothetical protein
VLREGARPDPLAVGSFLRCVLGRDREKAAAPTPDHRAFVESTDDLRGLGIDQARGVELPVRVVLVAPAVGEPLAEPGARHLTAQLGPETPAGVASASRHRALDVAQLGLYAGLDGPNDRGSQFHAIRNPSSPWKRAPQPTG